MYSEELAFVGAICELNNEKCSGGSQGVNTNFVCINMGQFAVLANNFALFGTCGKVV